MNEQSEQQTKPACPYYGICGGCQLQHLPYTQQLANKEQRLAYLLKPYYSGSLAVFASEPYGYRSRMDFIVTNKGLGQRSDRGTIAITTCPISNPKIETALTEINAWLAKTPSIEAFDPKRRAGTLKYVVVRAADSVAVSLMLNEDSPKLGAHVDAIKEFALTSSIPNILVAYSASTQDDSLSLEFFAAKGSEFLTEQFLGAPLTYHAQSFFQNNPRVAESMVTWARDALIANNCKDKIVVDAYGGVGTFAFPIAAHCAKVMSVESHPLAATCIAETKHRTNVSNIDAFTLDAGAMHKLNIPKDALFIVDPPRSGMDQRALRYLLQQAPPVIAYISCNPAQLAKELVILGKDYEVTTAALFDMFPQTNHIEAAVILKRRTQI